MFLDRSSMCKHGAQGGQTGSAVTQINEATHEPVCTVPSQSRSQCSAASCGQNFGPCCRQSFCLSQEQLPSQTVQPYSGVLERCQKWCSAGRRPHADVRRRIWEWFRDIGEEAHVDSVTKCKAHLSKAEQAKLDETGHATAAGNEWADELAKEGEREDSFQTVLCDMYKAAVKTSRAIISYIGSFILQAKGGERWPDVVTPPEKWCAKDERWKRVVPSLARPHRLARKERQWCCSECGRHASDGAAKAKLARTECVGHPATTLQEQARPQCHLLAQTGRFRVVLQVRSKGIQLREEACRVVRGATEVSQAYARSIRLLWSSWHPKENRFLGSPKLFTAQAWARMAAKLPRGYLRQSWTGRAQASS